MFHILILTAQKIQEAKNNSGVLLAVNWRPSSLSMPR